MRPFFLHSFFFFFLFVLFLSHVLVPILPVSTPSCRGDCEWILVHSDHFFCLCQCLVNNPVPKPSSKNPPSSHEGISIITGHRTRNEKTTFSRDTSIYSSKQTIKQNQINQTIPNQKRKGEQHSLTKKRRPPFARRFLGKQQT